MLTPRPGPALALAAALLAAGCSARVARPTAPAAAGCREASYRGRYEPRPDVAEGAAKGPRSFRASVRRCADGALLVELRGAVGGAQLLAAVRAGRVRLVLARERTVVDGVDSPALWERWTGLPISGALLAAALDATESGPTEREAAGWRVRVLAGAAGESFPARADADGPGGARIVLERQSERPARDGMTWPDVPAGFRLLVEPEGAA
ncbi:MAG: hypothetical protein MUC67_10865 [Acidobacteria bacterium]|jgi:hypothetical protein|nr:hypothetical protein [Acidobacteriota bacterium]MCU0252938.1 hypothetical protein [Acidobacteriota bacterium]